MKLRHLREGETAFPVAVADGCPTWRSGFKLVAFMLLPCLMSSRCGSVCGVHEGEPGSPLQGIQEAVGCSSVSRACCSSHFGHMEPRWNFLAEGWGLRHPLPAMAPDAGMLGAPLPAPVPSKGKVLLCREVCAEQRHCFG